MKIQCPGCDSAIPSENINIETGLAKCACGEVFRIGDFASSAREIAPEKPVDTKVVLEETPANELNVWLPGGSRIALVGLVPFALFWNGFLVFWTWGASRGSVLFALFSIPFWLIGLGMIFAILYTLFGRSSIHINSLGIAVVKELFGIRKRTVMPIEIIGEISVKEQGQGMRSRNTSQKVIAINYGTKKAEVGGGLSEVELEWIAWRMRKFLEKLKW